MIDIDPKMFETLEKKCQEAEEDHPAHAMKKLVETLQKDGLQSMIDLDPYFGDVTMPLAAECEALSEALQDDFKFFQDLMEELREDMEAHFEITELYEDEEFDQFVEDCKILKSDYTKELETSHKDNLHKAIEKVVSI